MSPLPKPVGGGWRGNIGQRNERIDRTMNCNNNFAVATASYLNGMLGVAISLRKKRVTNPPLCSDKLDPLSQCYVISNKKFENPSSFTDWHKE